MSHGMASINQLTLNILQAQGLSVFFQKTTDSTNAWAKKEFNGQTPLAVFLADQQNHGRGRGDNTWTQAPHGATLLSTWCLRLPQSPQPLFPLRTGLLLYESCQRSWPDLDWALKAPNDIYIQDGKWAGILIEVTEDGAFIGIGANIFAKPEGILQKTTSLQDWTVLTQKDWEHFCYFFSQGLSELQKDPARTTLLNHEIRALEQALLKYPRNQVKTVNSDGSLLLQNGKTIHWSDL